VNKINELCKKAFPYLALILVVLLTFPPLMDAANKWFSSLSIGSSTLDSSAVFSVNSTTLGAVSCSKMTQTQRDAISSPTDGLCVYNTSTNEVNHYNDSAGVWQAYKCRALGNLFDDCEADSTSTSVYTGYDDAAATPVDLSGGTASNFTVAAETADPLFGQQSVTFSKAAADAQGEGREITISIPSGFADSGRPLWVNFYYRTSANYANADITLWSYDVTNTTLSALNMIKNGSVNNELNSCGSSTCYFSAPIYPDSSTTTVRIGFHVATTNASAYDIDLDHITVRDSSSIQTSIISGPHEYTPAESGFSLGNGTRECEYTRLGALINIQCAYVFGSTSSFSGAFEVSPPSGVTLTRKNQELGLGNGHALDSGSDEWQIVAYVNGSGNVVFRINDGPTNDISNTIPHTWANNDRLSFNITYPVDEWSSGQGMSTHELNVRALKVRAYRDSTNQSIPNSTDTTVVFNAESYDNYSAFETSTSVFTAPISGVYKITVQYVWDAFAGGASTSIGKVVKNGSTTELINYLLIPAVSL